MITVKRYNPDAAMSISREHAWMRETPEGGHVEYGDYASLFAQFELVKAERDGLADRVNALAVENAALKSAITGKAYIDFVTSNGWNPGMKTINGKFAGFMDAEIDFGCMAYDHAKKLIDAVETPATDAALAAIQARILPENIAEIIDSGDLETICYGHEHPFAERIRLALYNFRQLREAK